MTDPTCRADDLCRCRACKPPRMCREPDPSYVDPRRAPPLRIVVAALVLAILLLVCAGGQWG